MTRTSMPCAPAFSHAPRPKQFFRHDLLTTLIAISAFVSTAVTCAAATPAVGDTFTYRIISGYSNEPYKQASYRIQSRDADRVVVAVTRTYYAARATGTEIYTPDGQWLRHTLASHDRLVDYEFSPACPAYVFPLEPGKQWSTRLNAVIPGDRRATQRTC